MIDVSALAWFASLCWISAGLAALPAGMIAVNLLAFRRPDRMADLRKPVSVIVPARNEEASIGACVQALLGSTNVEMEIIVVDDHSADRTAEIVRELAEGDARVRLHPAPALPAGWSGKQHACHSGASNARNPILMFMDCDVRVAPGAVAAMAGFLARSRSALVSGFPRERTDTLGEAMLIPLIHVLLLGYLPIPAIRLTRQVGLGAGCGQIMLADAAAYAATCGHAMIRSSWHDGLTLPRAFRRRGYMTDIFDATALAECRMYHGFQETWHGLSKNAHEGMATRTALPIWTLLLGGGLSLPFILMPLAWAVTPWPAGLWALGVSVAMLVLARLALAIRFRQNLLSVPLLPISIMLLLVLQWRAMVGGSSRSPLVWRGRTQLSP